MNCLGEQILSTLERTWHSAGVPSAQRESDCFAATQAEGDLLWRRRPRLSTKPRGLGQARPGRQLLANSKPRASVQRGSTGHTAPFLQLSASCRLHHLRSSATTDSFIRCLPQACSPHLRVRQPPDSLLLLCPLAAPCWWLLPWDLSSVPFFSLSAHSPIYAWPDFHSRAIKRGGSVWVQSWLYNFLAV